jgi:DNA-binding CsgD family transcriptional regulator
MEFVMPVFTRQKLSPSPEPTPSWAESEAACFEARCRQELSNAKGLSSLIDAIQSLVEDLGFSHFCYVLVAIGKRKRRPKVIHCGIGGPKGKDAVWQDDTLIQFLQVKQQPPTYLSVLFDYITIAPFTNDEIEFSKNLHRRMGRLGFYDTYNIPTHLVDDAHRSMLSVALKGASSEQLNKLVSGCEAQLQVLANAIALVGVCHHSDSFTTQNKAAPPDLPREPMSLLRRLAMSDKTIEQIAEERGVSRDTCNKQVAKIRHVLGANTNAAAVHTAMRLKLID